MMEMPLRDNTRGAEVTVAVHPAQRRRGVGTAIVEAMTEHGRADGRLVLNSVVDVPIDHMPNDTPTMAPSPSQRQLASSPCFRGTSGTSPCRWIPAGNRKRCAPRWPGGIGRRRLCVLAFEGAVAGGVPRRRVRAVPVHVDRRAPWAEQGAGRPAGSVFSAPGRVHRATQDGEVGGNHAASVATPARIDQGASDATKSVADG